LTQIRIDRDFVFIRINERDVYHPIVVSVLMTGSRAISL